MTEKHTGQSFFSNSLRFVKPFAPLLPQVRSPLRSPSLREKFVWTALAVLIYLVSSQVPLYGVINTATKGPMQWMRVLMASSRGTLMDLGIGPVVTSSMIMQFLSMTGIVSVDFSVKEDKILYDSLQKLISIIITVGQAIVQILSGFYGPVENLTKGSCLIILFQLTVSGLIIILLDELLQKGYGFGNGVNLFIVANVCEKIIWNAISPKAFYTGKGLEFEGCLIAMIHILLVRRNKLSALYEIFFRDNLPNLSTLILTFAIFAFVIYIQSIRVELPIISRRHKGVASSYPIALLYSSTTPVFMQNTIVSQFSNVSRLLYNYFPKNLLVRLLGVWEFRPSQGTIPISGLCYYIFPPSSIKDAINRPLFFLIYCATMLYTSAVLSRVMVDSQEDNSEAVFKRLKAQEMQLKGVRDANAVEKLDEYIPTAGFLGGLATSFVTLFCDILSTVGSGSNIFLAANIINQYMKLLAKETAKKSGKAFIE